MNDDPLPFQHKPAKSLNYHERVRAGLQRGGLNPMSKKKQSWTNKYIEKKKQDDEWQECKVCGKTNRKEDASPHHPHGRNDSNILIYWWLCNSCHELIHTNPKEARENGYLFF